MYVLNAICSLTYQLYRGRHPHRYTNRRSDALVCAFDKDAWPQEPSPWRVPQGVSAGSS
jgi:hypothetical protein